MADQVSVQNSEEKPPEAGADGIEQAVIAKLTIDKHQQKKQRPRFGGQGDLALVQLLARSR